MNSTSRVNGNAGAGTSSNGVTRFKPTLEIIPESRFFVFHGSEHEASSVMLRGVLRLTTPNSMSICRPRIRLEGKRKITWSYATGLGAGEVSDKRTFWSQEQKLGVETAHKINAGVMEWPFEFELAPAMPESVEGLRETYIAYHLHASVSRPGWNTKGLFAQEHIRLVRTLGPDSIGLTRSRINADIWANKISYNISIPTDAVVFGTSITADIELSPIRKGLRMGKVELRLIETLVKRIQTSELPDSRADRVRSDEFEVAKSEMEFPEHTKVVYDAETADSPVMADEMYKFKAVLPLPRSLITCRQDVDSHQISITHRLKLLVNIHNPEGHTSQLVCKLPVKLFISPHLPIDESHNVQDGVVGVADEALNNRDAMIAAPPQYGQHQLDQIFSDVDTAGFLSRAGSGHGTPADPSALSRRNSQDNIQSLAALSNGRFQGNMVPIDDLNSPSPSMLRSRLAALEERRLATGVSPPNGVSFLLSNSGTSSPRNDRDNVASRSGSYVPSGSYFPSNMSGEPSTSSSAPESRRESDELVDGPVSQGDYDMDNLTRVPSYGAALRTPGVIAPFSDGPPSYVEATSRPPSPGHISEVTSQQSPIQRPSIAHVRAQNAPHERRLTFGEDDARLRMLRAQT